MIARSQYRRSPFACDSPVCYTRPATGRGIAGLAQLVEQLFRKQQVVGSSPTVGSGHAGMHRRAEVAESADALRSGRSARRGVGVQISPSAPLAEMF